MVSLSLCLPGVCQIFYLIMRTNKFEDELLERSKTMDLSHDLSQDSFKDAEGILQGYIPKRLGSYENHTDYGMVL